MKQTVYLLLAALVSMSAQAHAERISTEIAAKTAKSVLSFAQQNPEVLPGDCRHLEISDTDAQLVVTIDRISRHIQKKIVRNAQGTSHQSKCEMEATGADEKTLRCTSKRSGRFEGGMSFFSLSYRKNTGNIVEVSCPSYDPF